MNQVPGSGVDLITSRRNPLVRRLRSLATSSGRQQDGHLLLEGTHQLQELLSFSRRLTKPVKVIATPAWLDSHTDLIDRLADHIDLQLMADEALRAALSTVHPDGVACLWPIEQLPLSAEAPSFVLALDRVQDPGNVGTLLRTALAADVEEVWLAAGADPLAPKVVRSAVGAVLRLPLRRLGPTDGAGVEQLAEQLLAARDRGLQVVAALVPDSVVGMPVIPYWQLDWCRPTVLVLGNEAAGLHPALQACCSHGVTLPHSSQVESLNVASAAVPLLLERRRATMTASMQLFG
ncbi:23S rRNA (uridine(2479)-2'-O)-methyltransferase [Synechococcus sp. MIT S9509]|uniref:TrmH family RNA methyltransferase n=1 Tax=Synechococcus sp. MIT S9509 TaxID=1801630 RepID=UPI0007BBA793|nr:RNA methyltransferase [Synechococcus sp. MIT S9509]KZR92427.1 23S rRNA (uridine(2479)-2'-O)-methyltransferase [Synechococcus sp. MIT S9509]